MAKKKKQQQSKAAAVKPKLAEKPKRKSITSPVTGSGSKKRANRLSVSSDDGVASRQKCSRVPKETLSPFISGDTIVEFSIDPNVYSSSPEKLPSEPPSPVSKQMTSNSRDLAVSVTLEADGSGLTTKNDAPIDKDRTKINSPTSTDYKMDSDSSDECYDSYEASSEPINIQDVIMGDSDITPLYLRYDSVINNALKSDDSVVVKPGSAIEVGKEPELSMPSITKSEEVVFEPDPYVVTKRKGDSSYSAKNPNTSSDLASDEEGLAVCVELSSSLTEVAGFSNDTSVEPSISTENTLRKERSSSKANVTGVTSSESESEDRVASVSEDSVDVPGKNEEWNSVRMSGCFVKVEKIQVKPTQDKNEPSAIKETATNLLSAVAKSNKQELTVTCSSSGPSPLTKPGPRGPLRRRAALANKTKGNPGNVELVNNQCVEKPNFPNDNLENTESGKTKSKRRLSADMVQARLSREVSVSQVQSVIHGVADHVADSRSSIGQMQSYNVSITPIIKKVDISHSSELLTNRPSGDETQVEFPESMKVDLPDEAQDSLPESVLQCVDDAVAEKCVALSRPRRQTRAPKRIADAIKPKVKSRSNSASKPFISSKGNGSLIADAKTAGQSKTASRTVEQKKKIKKSMSFKESESDKNPIPEIECSPLASTCSIPPTVNAHISSTVVDPVEMAVSSAPLALLQLQPPVKHPATLGSTEPEVCKSGQGSPAELLSTSITSSEGPAIAVSSKSVETHVTPLVKLDDVTGNRKTSAVLSKEAGLKDRSVDLSPELLDSQMKPSDTAKRAEGTLETTVCLDVEPPNSTQVVDVIKKPVPASGERVADVDAIVPNVHKALPLFNIDPVKPDTETTTIADSGLSSCLEPTVVCSSSVNISENVESFANSGSIKEKTVASVDTKNADVHIIRSQPSEPKDDVGDNSEAHLLKNKTIEEKCQETPPTTSVPEIVVEPQAALKERSLESSKAQAASIKESVPEPPVLQLSASKEKRSTTLQIAGLKEKKLGPLPSPTQLNKEKNSESLSSQIPSIKENKSCSLDPQSSSVKEKNVFNKQGIESTTVIDSPGKLDLSPKAALAASGPDTITSVKSQSLAAKPTPLLKDSKSVTSKPASGRNAATPDSMALVGKVLPSSQNSAKPRDLLPHQPEPVFTQSQCQPLAQKPVQDVTQKSSTGLPKLTEVDIFNGAIPPVKPPATHSKKGPGTPKTSHKSNEQPLKSTTSSVKTVELPANPDNLAPKTLPLTPKSPQASLKSPVAPKPSSTLSKSCGAQPETDDASSFATEASPATTPVDVDVPVKVQTASLSLEVPSSPKTEPSVVPKPVELPKPSPSKPHSSSPKVVSASKASSPKVSPAPKSSGPRVATKAALKSFGSLKPQLTPKAAGKPPQKSTKSTAKAATPKGAKGIAKATAKLAMAQEFSSKVEIGATPPETKCEPDIKSVAAACDAPTRATAKTGVAKEESTKAPKTPKSEAKKEKEAAKKAEGSTRRRSNRIRINRWDEGPNIAAAAAAAAASAATTSSSSGQAETGSLSLAIAPGLATAVSQMSLKNTETSVNLFPPPPPPASGFETDKPVKVKSRWRRTSELEMGSRTGSAHDTGIPTSPAPAGMTSPSSSSPVPPPPPPPSEPPPASSANSPTRPSADLPLSAADEQVSFKAPRPAYDFEHPEIAERMKQFEVIQESIYLTERHQSKETKRMVCECTLSDEEVARGDLGCGEDCLNRLLFIECSRRCTLGSMCSNKRFQNHENAKCAVVRTQDKGLGLIASSQIPGGEFLMEYVGEVIDPKEFRRRAKDYSKEKNRHFYFMSLKSDSIIDATIKGSISRFINHSCDPNAETQKWTVNGELRIGFFSKRQINENEEITFDYQFQRYGKEAIRCFCGSANCRGWIGEDPDNDEKEEEKDQKLEKREKREKKKSREKILEELEEEIEKLRLSGIKNRAHTLMLNRLMVRAEDHSSRSQLLAITQAGVDQRCLRLFLDYHGLNLLWSWMVDHSAPTSIKIQILDVLSVLPITNKTILQDSKVLGVVERWANSGNSSAEPKLRPEDEKESSSPDSEETTNDGSATPSTEKKKCDPIPDPDDPERQTLVAKATALFQGWSVLKEEFRIPKKQKIEQMKEHERDADRGYVDHEKAVKTENSYDRHWSFDKDRPKRRGRESSPDSVEWKAKSSRSDEKHSGPRLSKSQRRQLFAMKVEEEERQKRMEEERWANHQEQCYALGVDPNMTYPPQANGGYYHPLDGPDVPPDVYGPGDPRGPPMYPPPPPSPFMGGPPPPPDPSYPPMSPFQQMNMVPSGPSPPVMGPGMGAPPPGMPPMGPPPGMVPHPPGMGPPPPGMVPPGMPPGMPMMGMGPFGGPPSMQPFPPNGMPPMPVPYSNPPMPPQPNYAASPFAPSMVQALEPPPNGAIPLNSSNSMNKPAYIIKLPENWAIALDKDRNAIYYYHCKTKHVQWHFPTVKDDKTEEAKLEKIGIKTTHADDSEDSEEEEEESESEEDESSSDEFEKEEEEDDDEYDDNQLLADAKRKAEEEMMIQNVVTEPSILASEEARDADVKMSDVLVSSIVADTSQPTAIASESGEPVPKKKREGLVTVNIISPRDEADDYRKGIKKSKIRETKMKLARQKAKAKAKARAAAAGYSGKVKVKRTKMCEADTSTGQSRKMKKFRSEMANVIVALLNPYMRPDCKMGRITTNDDFKHLARKLTHFVMVKEMKHLPAIENLQCNDNVRHKAKDFIRKYMSKFGEVYSRLPDD